MGGGYFLILSIGLFFNACQKDELNTTTKKESVTPEIFYKVNRLTFNTVDAYENTIAKLSDPETIKNLEQTNESPLQTFKKSVNQNEELYNDFLLSILNEDKIVQIGKWIIKVDMENEHVSVISEDNINYMDDIINDVDNDSIYKFSTKDDVLDLLKAGAKASPENSIAGLKKWCWGCCDSKAIAHNDWTTIGQVLHYTKQTVQVRYYKSGIYYALFARIYSEGTTNRGNSFDFGEKIMTTMNLEYEFYDRCGRSYDRSHRAEIKTGNFPNDEILKRVYESSHNLSKYRLDTRFTLKYYHYNDYLGTRIENLSISSQMGAWIKTL